MKEIKVKIKKLHPDAVIPSYSHDGDVGMDMTAIEQIEKAWDNQAFFFVTGGDLCADC